MADSGNPTQWGDSYPPQEMLEEDIDSNRLFVYMVNGRLEAVFAFILGPDPTYAKIEDGQWLNDEVPYGTIHRLASAGDRRGVASEVIAWCLEHCESLFSRRTVLPAAASSMWKTARPASPIRSCRPPYTCRKNKEGLA